MHLMAQNKNIATKQIVDVVSGQQVSIDTEHLQPERTRSASTREGYRIHTRSACKHDLEKDTHNTTRAYYHDRSGQNTFKEHQIEQQTRRRDKQRDRQIGTRCRSLLSYLKQGWDIVADTRVVFVLHDFLDNHAVRPNTLSTHQTSKNNCPSLFSPGTQTEL